MDNTDTILDAGLSFTCDFEKEGGFIGIEHVLQAKAKSKESGGLTRRMVSVKVPLEATDPILYHGEILYRNGQPISDIRMGSYGHTINGGVGLAMLQSKGGDPIKKDFIETASWELEIADKMYPCEVSLSAFYDPKNTRIKL